MRVTPDGDTTHTLHACERRHGGLSAGFGSSWATDGLVRSRVRSAGTRGICNDCRSLDLGDSTKPLLSTGWIAMDFTNFQMCSEGTYQGCPLAKIPG